MSNLLQKASIVTTPTAYGVGVLNSIKPAYALGENLVINGDFLTNTVEGWNNWDNLTLPQNTSQNNGYGILDSTNGTCDARQNITVVAGYKYKITATMYQDSGANGKFYMSDGANYSYAFGNFQATETETTFSKVVQPTQTIIRLYAYNTGNNKAYYKNIKIEQVTDADFDFTRTSSATRVNPDYLIEDVPYNLLSYSEDYSQSAWSKTNLTSTSNDIISPDGTLNASKLTVTSTGALLETSQSLSVGNTFTISAFVKEGTCKFVRLAYSSSSQTGAWFNLEDKTVGTVNSTSASIENYGNGWYRIISTFDSQVASGGLFLGLSNTDGATGDSVTGHTVYVWGVQLVKGDQPKDYLKTTDRLDIPRLDYTNGTASILLEPQSTNLIQYSEDLSDSYWSKTRASITDNSLISPDGNYNADKFTQITSTAWGGIVLTVSPSGTSTLSVFAKKIDNDYIAIIGHNSNDTKVYFNLNNGTIGTVGSDVTSSDIQDYGNGWYRCILTASVVNRFTVLHATADNGNTADLNTETSLWGAQLEEKSYATSYIPTSGSTVTRAAETLNNAGNSDLINSTEGVLYLDFASLNNSGNYRLISLSDGTTSNRLFIGFRLDTGYIYYFVIVAGSTQASNITTITATDFTKVAVKWKANDFALWVDGVEISSDTSGISFPADTLNTIQMNEGDGAGFEFYGKTKCLAVFKEALSDTELACLTSTNNREIFLNYYYRMQYVEANTEALSCAEQTFNI